MKLTTTTFDSLNEGQMILITEAFQHIIINCDIPKDVVIVLKDGNVTVNGNVGDNVSIIAREQRFDQSMVPEGETFLPEETLPTRSQIIIHGEVSKTAHLDANNKIILGAERKKQAEAQETQRGPIIAHAFQIQQSIGHVSIPSDPGFIGNLLDTSAASSANQDDDQGLSKKIKINQHVGSIKITGRGSNITVNSIQFT